MMIMFETAAARRFVLSSSILGFLFFLGLLTWSFLDYKGRVDSIGICFSSLMIFFTIIAFIRGLKLDKSLLLKMDSLEILERKVRRIYLYSDIERMEYGTLELNFTIYFKGGDSFLVEQELRVLPETIDRSMQEIFERHNSYPKLQSLRFLKDFFQQKTGIQIKN